MYCGCLLRRITNLPVPVAPPQRENTQNTESTSAYIAIKEGTGEFARVLLRCLDDDASYPKNMKESREAMSTSLFFQNLSL